MRSRIFATAGVVFGGVLSVSAALAAPAAVGTTNMRLASSPAPDRSQVVNFSLGSIVIAPFGQDFATASLANGSQIFQLDYARGRNWELYGELFPGPLSLRSSYLQGSTSALALRFGLSDSLSFSVGHEGLALGALDANQPSVFSRELAARLGGEVRSVGTTTAKLNWNFSDWGGLALSASRSSGNSALLGVASGALATGSAADSAALGISARVGFGEGWVTTVAYNEGVTQLDLNRALMPNGDALRSQAYGIAVAKQGLFGDDALGIAVSRPLDVYAGNGSLGSSAPNFALANSPVRESDVELGYVTTFLDGTLALQANAAYQLNTAGVKGQNAVTGVARAKLNF